MADEVKWWQYPPEVLAFAAKMHKQGHFWSFIAKYLYESYECPLYQPDLLGRAVRAAMKADGPPKASPDRRRAPPPLPPPPKPPVMPKEEPGPPVDLRADWAKQFPDRPFPAEPEAIAALARAERRRRS